MPKYADEEHAAAGAPGVRIDPTQTQNLGGENRRRHPRAAALRPDLPGQHQL